MNSDELTDVSNAPAQHAQQRKGGFMQGLPGLTTTTSQGLGTTSVCCGEPAVSGESSTGGGCCGEPVASTTTVETVTTGGCCGEPTSFAADGAAAASNGSGCCN
jgi:hypothetical protein